VHDLMSNDKPEIPPGNPIEVPPVQVPPNIPPDSPDEIPPPPQELPPKSPVEVPPSPSDIALIARGSIHRGQFTTALRGAHRFNSNSARYPT